MPTSTESLFHKSVLVPQVLNAIATSQENPRYLDVTLGGGGHTRALLTHNPTATVIGLDWDKQSLDRQAEQLSAEFGTRFQPIWGNFAHLYRLIKPALRGCFDGILADFGTSQHQIQTTPGLSFAADTPLDMRLSTAHHFIKAEDVINRYPEKVLADIFFNLADESLARPIAKAIAHERMKTPFVTTRQLATTVERVVYSYTKGRRERRIHPATKVFQALRIYVNKELENIDSLLKAAYPLLKPHGRIACISFHSLEDRIVKTFFRESSERFTTITAKPIVPEAEECERNPSARSARLRVAEKKNVSELL